MRRGWMLNEEDEIQSVVVPKVKEAVDKHRSM